MSPEKASPHFHEQIDNFHGTVAYSNSFFFEGPPVKITQRGDSPVNVTLWGNAFWGDNDTAVTFDMGEQGSFSAVANLLADYGTQVTPGGQTN